MYFYFTDSILYDRTLLILTPTIGRGTDDFILTEFFNLCFRGVAAKI